MLDICLLASDPSPIDSLSLSLPFVLCNAIDARDLCFISKSLIMPAAFDARIH